MKKTINSVIREICNFIDYLDLNKHFSWTVTNHNEYIYIVIGIKTQIIFPFNKNNTLHSIFELISKAYIELIIDTYEENQNEKNN